MAAFRAARLVCSAALLAAAPYVQAADLYYLGAQYTPGPGYPVTWPTEGSYFDPNNWLGNAIPTSTATAIFGSDQPMPNGNTTNAPHTIHFGNFGYFGTTTISGGTATIASATFLSDNWTFDFGSGQNPDFTGTVVPSVGTFTSYLNYLIPNSGILQIAPPSGTPAGLTVQNGTLATTALTLAPHDTTDPLLPGSATFHASGSTTQVNVDGTVTLNSGNATLLVDNAAHVAAGVGIIGNGPQALASVPSASLAVSAVGSSFSATYLYFGYSAASLGTGELSNGSINISSSEYIGYSGTGSFTQSGGSHTAVRIYLAYNAGSSGAYTLSGGQLAPASLVIGYGGVGDFSVLGSTLTASTCNLGYSSGATGSLRFAGGQMTFSVLEIGLSGAGTLQHSSGSNAPNSLTLGKNAGGIGLYILESGSCTSSYVTIGAAGKGTFTQREGTTTIQTLHVGEKAGSVGLLELQGGQLNVATALSSGEAVGSYGTGNILQSGGLHTTKALTLGYNAGAVGGYTLTAGQFIVQREIIGDSGTGSFAQSGGTHTISETLNVAAWAAASGTYRLDDGLLVAPKEDLGHAGKAQFIQNGGTNTASQYVYLGSDSYSAGSYSLNNGLLSTYDEVIGYFGSGTFVHAGGTNTITRNLIIAYYPFTKGTYTLSNSAILSAPNLYVGGSKNTSGGVAVLDITGGTATITSTLKLWATLGNSLSFTGGTLSVGTLTIVEPSRFLWTAGTLQITGPTAPALTIPTAGTFLGTPTIAGNLTNHRLLSPGNFPGLLTIRGNFTQSASATLLLEIAGPALADFDRLAIPGTGTLPGNVSLAGTIALDFLPAYTPTIGDSFDLLDWTGSLTNNGYSFDFTHAPLPQGLVWDTSAFSATGVITIVPEPTSLILLSLGSLSLVQTRRRVSRSRHIQPAFSRRRIES